MVELLEAHRTAILQEEATIKQRNTELEQTQNLLMSLALDDARWLTILNAETGAVLFESQSVKTAFEEMPALAKILLAAMTSCACNAQNTPMVWECPAILKAGEQIRTHYYSIVSHAIPWQGEYAVAHSISDVTERRQNEIELERMAFSDPLTGVYNRRYGMNSMEELAGKGTDFLVAFIDIDYLKYCNDQFGHEEGNRYIIAVADGFKRMKDSPLVCRVGGDEFMLVQQKANAERFEQNLAAFRAELINGNSAYRRSFSYGICPYDGTASLTEVLETADKRMYAFKLNNKARRDDWYSDAGSDKQNDGHVPEPEGCQTGLDRRAKT